MIDINSMKRYTRKRKTFKKQRIHKRSYKKQLGGQADDKCIFVHLGGNTKHLQLGAGFGNQLFIYAAGLVVKKKLGLPLYLLPSTTNQHSSTDYRYLFKQGKPVEYADMQGRINASRKIHEGLSMHGTFTDKNIPTNSPKNVTLEGLLYQNYSNIKSAIPDIRKELLEEFEKKYSGFKDTVVPNATAFMHVRRGDYLIQNRQLDAEYFNKGLSILNENKEITTIYVVSDDIKWCKNQKFEEKAVPKKLVYFNEPDELKTMYLMMLCKGGAVLSRSTFSCWGGFLGPDENPTSTIVMPEHFGSEFSRELMLPERWKII